MTDDLDVLPDHTARMAGAERLHRGLLGGKSAGDVRNGIAPPGTISDLAVGQDAPKEPVTVPLKHLSDARNVGRVEAEPENIHDPSQA